MHSFTISANEYLEQDIQAFYHTDYLRYGQPGNPDYINMLKNTYDNNSRSNLGKLNDAAQKLKSVLRKDLPKILQELPISPLTVCVVPRAKAEDKYSQNQLRFKSTVRDVVVNQLDGFIDGTDYIRRHTTTKTTHITDPFYPNEGKAPYQGITVKTCDISNDIRGKNILLIDDIYTKTVNIDEDAIQALLNKGAKSVVFYAVGRTRRQ